MNRPSPLSGAAAAVPILAAALMACSPKASDDLSLDEKAKGIHDRVMTMDTHVDISPANFKAGEPNYASRLPRTRVDLDKMEQGGLDAVWLVVYTGQGELNEAGYASAYDQAMEKFAAIHRLTDSIAPDRVGLALTSDDARRIYASGRKVVFIGVENGYPIGTDVSRVQQFYDLGARYLSLAHNGHSQLSDSNTGERDDVWLYDGISPLGKQVVAEANRLGIMLDVSHPSRQTMLQLVELSKAPLIASHSGVRAICNHSRNLDDEELQALKKNGGVVQLVAFSTYVKCDPATDSVRTAQRDSAMRDLRATVRPSRAGARPRGLCRDARAGGLAARGSADRLHGAAGGDHDPFRRAAGDRERLRGSHRLRREADRHRPRGHQLRLRRRRRRGRVEQCRRDAERHARVGEARLQRGGHREDLERESAAGAGPGAGGGGKERELDDRRRVGSRTGHTGFRCAPFAYGPREKNDAWGRSQHLPSARASARPPYLKLPTMLCVNSDHPSTSTKSSSLNGSEIIAGGSMNMPMLISTDATTTSMTMNGRKSAKPI